MKCFWFEGERGSHFIGESSPPDPQGSQVLGADRKEAKERLSKRTGTVARGRSTKKGFFLYFLRTKGLLPCLRGGNHKISCFETQRLYLWLKQKPITVKAIKNNTGSEGWEGGKGHGGLYPSCGPGGKGKSAILPLLNPGPATPNSAGTERKATEF